MKKNSTTDRVAEILRKSYRRIVVPDEESGQYHAEIAEFPGCFAVGRTAEEALKNVEDAAISWIEASLKLNHQIPGPENAEEFSGKILLRLPKSLHGRVATLAKREGVSINHLLSSFVSESMGERLVLGAVWEEIRSAQTAGTTVKIGGVNFQTSLQESTGGTRTISFAKDEDVVN